MAIWKKVTSFFFEETDADVIAEDELEPIEINKTVQVEKELEKPSVSRVVNESPLPKTPVTVQEEKSSFANIEINNAEKAPVEKEHREIRSSRVSPSLEHVVRKEEKKEFEFTPVISPIFGAKEEVTSKNKKNGNATAKSATILRATNKKKNPLGTIISPYFGVNELEEFEAEAQKDIEEKEKIRKEEVSADVVEKLDQQAEVNSISLQDLIVDDDIEEDDLMQISLFGESSPVHEAESKIKDTTIIEK